MNDPAFSEAGKRAAEKGKRASRLTLIMEAYHNPDPLVHDKAVEDIKTAGEILVEVCKSAPFDSIVESQRQVLKTYAELNNTSVFQLLSPGLDEVAAQKLRNDLKVAGLLEEAIA